MDEEVWHYANSRMATLNTSSVLSIWQWTRVSRDDSVRWCYGTRLSPLLGKGNCVKGMVREVCSR